MIFLRRVEPVGLTNLDVLITFCDYFRILNMIRSSSFSFVSFSFLFLFLFFFFFSFFLFLTRLPFKVAFLLMVVLILAHGQLHAYWLQAAYIFFFLFITETFLLFLTISYIVAYINHNGHPSKRSFTNTSSLQLVTQLTTQASTARIP